MSSPSNVPRIAVVGARGYGRTHVRTIAGWAARGTAELAAVVDTAPTDDVTEIPEGTPTHPSLDDLLSDGAPDVVAIATPIHTHLALARRALEAGADVLLEKPPTATYAEFEELLEVERATGRSVQVGFQARGSAGIALVRDIVASGAVGSVLGIGAFGTWVRYASYYARAPWAGRRTLDGRIVMDGVATNPLAHSIDLAFAIDDSLTGEDVVELRVDPYHAHPIETDDTTAVVARTARGTRVAAGLTLCAETYRPPAVTVRGTMGAVTFDYAHDLVTIRTAAGDREHQVGRVDVLANLVDHAATGAPLVCPLASTGAFMRVLEALRIGPAPAAVDPAFVTWEDADGDPHPVIAGVDEACRRVAESGRTFAELGVPWAVAAAA